MKIKNAIICAAGIGSRLGLDIPKCLVKIGKHRLIYYLLNILKDVPNIRVVVGFKEEEVIKYVSSIRKDVLFIRNPEYRNTTNAYSLYLGTFDLKEPYLTIDGDIFMDINNFQNFVSCIHDNQNFIGITKAYTEEPVYVELDNNNNVIGFNRKKVSDYEWTGVAYFNNVKINKDGKYVYQELENYLPIKACKIECYEIDTPKDLEYVTNKINFNDFL